MNNTQLYLAIGLPMVVFILTWLSNRAEMTRHVDRLDRQFEGLRGEMISLRRDINADMVAFRREVHGDLLMLHERVVKVESKES